MRSAFAQFLAFPTDVEDNKASMVTKLTMPVLAIGGEQSFGANEAVVMRNALLARQSGLSLERCAVIWHISPMALYRLVCALAHHSLVTVQIRCGLALPPYFLADEKHSRCLTDKASAHDGFDSTINSLRTLLPRAHFGNCLRHAIIKLPGKLVAIASPVREALRSQFHTLLYRARQRRGLRVFALGQRLRRFADHAATAAGLANGERVRPWLREGGLVYGARRPADAGD